MATTGGPSSDEPTLGGVLQILQGFGMLERAYQITVGSVEVRLLPQGQAPADAEKPKKLDPRQEYYRNLLGVNVDLTDLERLP